MLLNLVLYLGFQINVDYVAREKLWIFEWKEKHACNILFHLFFLFFLCVFFPGVGVGGGGSF